MLCYGSPSVNLNRFLVLLPWIANWLHLNSGSWRRSLYQITVRLAADGENQFVSKESSASKQLIYSEHLLNHWSSSKPNNARANKSTKCWSDFLFISHSHELAEFFPSMLSTVAGKKKGTLYRLRERKNLIPIAS